MGMVLGPSDEPTFGHVDMLPVEGPEQDLARELQAVADKCDRREEMPCEE